MAKSAPDKSNPLAPPSDAIPVTVDGKQVVVPKISLDPVSGRNVPTTMIQACTAAGVEVPHYCYHPKLPVSGNCRMCLVEFGTQAIGPDRKPILNPDGTPRIAKAPRPAIACATPVSSGMEIYTNTAGVKQMRESVLEFLLINHPLDCPICDQAGECKLQEYSVEFGQFASRFVEHKVHKPKQVDLGPRIMLDDERCILCTRCIRFTRDIAGDDALGIVNRGSYNTLSAYPGKPFDNNYTLNTADICPVGALTSKDFRFQMRVWFLKETKSLCTSCGTGCNVLIGSREDKVYRYVPRENDAVNSCWMCDEGRLDYKWIGREDRLKKIVVRRNQKKAETGTWSSVIKEISTRLSEAAPGSTAIIASSRQTNEELYLLASLSKHLDALTDTVPRKGKADAILVSADRNPNSSGAKLTKFVTKKAGGNFRRIVDRIQNGQIKTLLVFGEDITQHGISEKEVALLDTLVVCDILPNATTELAHFLLPGCAHAEKRGTFTNANGRIQKFMKAVEPPGDARPEWEFLHELVNNVAGNDGYSSIEGLFNQMATEIRAMRGLSWGVLGDTGATVKV